MASNRWYPTCVLFCWMCVCPACGLGGGGPSDSGSTTALRGAVVGAWVLANIDGNAPGFEAEVTFEADGTYEGLERSLEFPLVYFSGTYNVFGDQISARYTVGYIDRAHTGLITFLADTLAITNNRGVRRAYVMQ